MFEHSFTIETRSMKCVVTNHEMFMINMLNRRQLSIQLKRWTDLLSHNIISVSAQVTGRQRRLH